LKQCKTIKAKQCYFILISSTVNVTLEEKRNRNTRAATTTTSTSADDVHNYSVNDDDRGEYGNISDDDYDE
jgi:hypothetical protein